MKHYKSVEMCQFLQCQSPLHKRKVPLLGLQATVVTVRSSSEKEYFALIQIVLRV